MSEDVDEADHSSEATEERAGEDPDAAGAAGDLAARLAGLDDEAIADEIGALQDELAETEARLAERDDRIDELESRLKRERADFQNYKKRTEERREADRQRAVATLLERLLDVRDNLERALAQDEDVDIRDGVESTLRQFDRILGDEDVEPIEPDPGTEIDPERHEVLTTVESDHPPGTVTERYRIGYALDERIIRPAQVVASADTGEPDEDSSTPDEASEEEPPDAEGEAGTEEKA